MESAGSLNQGLFQKSYSFIKDMQADRMRSLYDNMKNAKKHQDEDKISRLNDLISEEKQFMAKQRSHDKERQAKLVLKKENQARVDQGKDVVFVKKREIKQAYLKTKFESLEKTGKIDRFLEKKHEEYCRN